MSNSKKPNGNGNEPNGRKPVHEPQPPKQKLLMIIPINDPGFDQMATKFMNAAVDPGFEVVVRSLRCGSRRIESRYDVVRNGNEVMRLIESMGDEILDYSGLYIADYDNAGVDPIREAVGIPVVGGSGPQLATLVELCQKFAIITVDDVLTPMNVSLVRAMGLTNSLVGIYDIDLRIGQLVEIKAEKVRDLVLAKAVEAVVDGAQAIVLGCTGFLDVAFNVGEKLGENVFQFLERNLPGKVADKIAEDNKRNKRNIDSSRVTALSEGAIYIPVLDPNVVAINFLAMLVRCRIAHSEVCYRIPPQLEKAARKRKQLHRQRFLNGEIGSRVESKGKRKAAVRSTDLEQKPPSRRLNGGLRPRAPQ